MPPNILITRIQIRIRSCSISKKEWVPGVQDNPIQSRQFPLNLL